MSRPYVTLGAPTWSAGRVSAVVAQPAGRTAEASHGAGRGSSGTLAARHVPDTPWPDGK